MSVCYQCNSIFDIASFIPLQPRPVSSPGRHKTNHSRHIKILPISPLHRRGLSLIINMSHKPQEVLFNHKHVPRTAKGPLFIFFQKALMLSKNSRFYFCLLLLAQGYFFKLYPLLPLTANTISPYNYYRDSHGVNVDKKTTEKAIFFVSSFGLAHSLP